MKISLMRISQDAINGLQEFSQNPVKYSSRALVELVKDYSDVGAAVATALAFSPYGDDIYGKYWNWVGVSGLTATVWMPKLRENMMRRNPDAAHSSITRNLYAGLSTVLIAIDNSEKGSIPVEIGMKLFEAFALAGFGVMEHARIMDIRTFQGNDKSKSLEESL